MEKHNTWTVLGVMVGLLLSGTAQAGNAMVSGGQGADPAHVWPQLTALVDDIAADHNLPTAQVQDFNNHLMVSYTQRQTAVGGAFVRRSLSGRVLFPVCSQEKTKRSIAFQVEDFVTAADDTKIQVTAAISEKLELALMDYATTCLLVQ
jgi:hypothetical protein